MVGKTLVKLIEGLSSLPGCAFLERYSNRIRSAQGAVRGGRDRAKEIQRRGRDIKGSANELKGGKNKPGEPPKAGATNKETTKNLRTARRQSRSSGLDPDAAPRPRRSPGAPDLSQDARGKVRDTSPNRDGGRSLRKRKEDF